MDACPCCKQNSWDGFCPIQLATEWGLESFIECLKCGIIFRYKRVDGKEGGNK